MPTDPRVDAYIARQADFAQPILAWLRARIHASCPEIEETIKWGRPAFYYKGRPLAGVAAFKAHAGFGFWIPTPSRRARKPKARTRSAALNRSLTCPMLPRSRHWCATRRR